MVHGRALTGLYQKFGPRACTRRGKRRTLWQFFPAEGDSATSGSAISVGLDASVSQATGNAITNQFQDADITTYDSGFSCLSRSDWEETFPGAAYQNGSWEAPQEVLDATTVSYEPDSSAAMPTFGSAATNLTLARLIGADFNDERWNQLMDQMSKQELWDLVRKSGYLSLGIDSIDMPQVTLKDGSAGISGTLTGSNVECMGYPVEGVRDGGAKGVMVARNRMGPRWAGGSDGLKAL